MFYAIGIVICLVLSAHGGGYGALMALASLPVVGSWVDWYANYVPVNGFGVAANLMYAAMAMQVIIVMLGLVSSAPSFVIKLARFANTRMRLAKAEN